MLGLQNILLKGEFTEEKGLSYYENGHIDLRKVTLAYLVNKDNGNVLIAMKKRGFGSGRFNGVGGKLKEGESVKDAMMRETKEEIGVTPKSFEETGVINFYFDGGRDDFNQEVHVFVIYSWEGEPSESEEMKPMWIAKDHLPFEKMWPDDKYWLSDLLEGRRINASFLFGEGDIIKEMKVERY
jgi:8-oxo-dGTP pyrophosphatase MutT (NUDIX family)